MPNITAAVACCPTQTSTDAIVMPCCGYVLQNANVTTIWCICLVQVVAPAVMFTAECYPYCKKANKPELMLVGALVLYTTLCCTLSPGWYDANDIFLFYSLPFSFSVKLELISLACVLGYLSVLMTARHVLSRYEERRIGGGAN